jgi:hypothetical protein
MHKELNFNVAIPSFLDVEIYFISGDRERNHLSFFHHFSHPGTTHVPGVWNWT